MVLTRQQASGTPTVLLVHSPGASRRYRRDKQRLSDRQRLSDVGRAWSKYLSYATILLDYLRNPKLDKENPSPVIVFGDLINRTAGWFIVY